MKTNALEVVQDFVFFGLYVWWSGCLHFGRALHPSIPGCCAKFKKNITAFFQQCHLSTMLCVVRVVLFLQ